MSVHPALSVWQRLKKREVSCEDAINLLIDPSKRVNLNLLDSELTERFFRDIPNHESFPPLIPLLLWRNCYYLGSPFSFSEAEKQRLAAQVFTEIVILPISTISYQDWAHERQLERGQLVGSAAPTYGNPEEQAQEDIGEMTERHLSKADDQIKRIRTLIKGALQSRASDIHLEPQSDGGLRVRYRIDGILRNITILPADISRRAIVALKVMADMDIAESRRPQDARIGTKYSIGQNEDLGLDMRVSTLPCIGGEKAVIRLLPRENPFDKIEELGFSERSLKTYLRWLKQPQGLIILTGPTGSGKTSTLYTSLQTIATEDVNVVTVEDPVEYVLPQITQTQVHEAAGMTFAAGLRAILRQDPDIIMVGEIRDHETAETAIRAALTGHRVLTTLHTNDAVSAIPRLKDIGPDPGLLSDALLGIIAQRLVRKVCPHCAEPYTPTTEDLEVLGLTAETARSDGWRKGKGCSRCFNSGYLGREAVMEVLDVDSNIRQLIYEGTTTELQRYLKEMNYASFLMGAIEKVTTGVTTVEEILRVLPHSSLYPQKVTSKRSVPVPIPSNDESPLTSTAFPEDTPLYAVLDHSATAVIQGSANPFLSHEELHHPAELHRYSTNGEIKGLTHGESKVESPTLDSLEPEDAITLNNLLAELGIQL